MVVHHFLFCILESFASSLVPSHLSKSLVLPSAFIEETVHPTPLKLQPPNIRVAFQICEHQQQHWCAVSGCTVWAVWNLKNLPIATQMRPLWQSFKIQTILSKSIVSKPIQQKKTKKHVQSQFRAIFYFRRP